LKRGNELVLEGQLFDDISLQIVKGEAAEVHIQELAAGSSHCGTGAW
jgi:hypothetical protein